MDLRAREEERRVEALAGCLCHLEMSRMSGKIQLWCGDVYHIMGASCTNSQYTVLPVTWMPGWI